MFAKVVPSSLGVRQEKWVVKTQRQRGEVHFPYRIPSIQLHEEASHDSGEQRQTRNTTNLGEKLRKIVQLLL